MTNENSGVRFEALLLAVNREANRLLTADNLRQWGITSSMLEASGMNVDHSDDRFDVYELPSGSDRWGVIHKNPKCLNCCRDDHDNCDDFLTVSHSAGEVSVGQCGCNHSPKQ